MKLINLRDKSGLNSKRKVVDSKLFKFFMWNLGMLEKVMIGIFYVFRVYYKLFFREIFFWDIILDFF